MLKHVACFDSATWVDSHIPFIDVLNLPFLVDHKRSAVAKALFLVEDAIIPDHCAFEIAEQRERYSNLFCEFAVGGNTVYAEAEDLSVCCFEFRDISLIRF
jgi:hypothetical protein